MIFKDNRGLIETKLEREKLTVYGWLGLVAHCALRLGFGGKIEL